MTMTPRLHSDRIVFCRAQIELIAQVMIPDLKDHATKCRLEGRYATACGFMALIKDLEIDLAAYRRSVDFHLEAITRGE